MFAKKLKEGNYRAVLIIDTTKGLELPFNFEVRYENKKPLIIIRNADEHIRVDEILIEGDSLFFQLPVFDTEFKCKLVGKNIEGVWINHYRTSQNTIPFKAKYDESKRFLFAPEDPDPIFEGNWEVTFSPGQKNSSKAIGVFKHNEQSDYVFGTFLTETGDYRFLEGMKNGKKLMLSCFDGSHAFLFEAELVNDTLKGIFYSGAHFSEPWIAVRNKNFKLKDAEEVTFLKDNTSKFSFSFPDLDNKIVSLNDERFANKPVIIQIMGSWCPNCLDESKYLVELYKQYHSQGLEIVALAYEKTTDPAIARKQVQRLKDRLHISYPLLLTLQSGKEKASETFSIFNAITAFPTSIFLNKKHEVVKIYTGFNGPATGNDYLIFKERIENLISTLVK